jgi:pimeloyl-ACP methyl ester carboxylesterase
VKKITFIAAGLALVSAAIPTSTFAAAQKGAVITPLKCPDVSYRNQLDCFAMAVPENRANPDGRTIQLAVAVLKAKKAPLPDPVLLIQGGPGEAAIPDIEYWLDSPVREQRDIIFLDQRGTGLSAPLNCPEVGDAVAQAFVATGRTPRAELESTLAAARQCHDRFKRDGADLDGYNSLETIEDIEALRKAKGIAQWNIYSISYGTRVAQLLMREYPQNLRSVILDSGSPLGEFETTPANLANDFELGLQHLFKKCVSDTQCRSVSPNLQASFDAMVTSYNAKPYRQKLKHNGKNVQLEITGSDLVALVAVSLKNEDMIPNLPALIAALGQRNDVLLKQQVAPIVTDGLMSGGGIGFGTQLSVDCADFPPRYRADDATLLRSQDKWSTLWLLASNAYCAVWPVKPVPSWFYETNRAATPTLLFSGSFDSISLPKSQTEIMGLALPRSTYVEIGSAGHGPTHTNACAKSIMHVFYNDPNASLDVSCVEGQKASFADLPKR